MLRFGRRGAVLMDNIGPGQQRAPGFAARHARNVGLQSPIHVRIRRTEVMSAGCQRSEETAVSQALESVVRPPRVQITYELRASQVWNEELPFIVGVLADLAGHPDPDAEPPPDLVGSQRRFAALLGPQRRFVGIDTESFDVVIARINPRLALRVPNELQKDGTRIAVELHFRHIEDFEPVNVVRQVGPLRRLLEARERLAELKTWVANTHRGESSVERIIDDKEPLRRVARETGGMTDDSQASTASTQTPAENDYLNMIDQLVEGIMNRKITVSDDTEPMLNNRIAELDQLLSDQLNAIMHDPMFQKLEASWRGLHYLVFDTEKYEGLRIRVLNISKSELLRDMKHAPELDQSDLFRWIYREEHEDLGGRPYGVLIGDFEFGEHPLDIALLKRIAQVAAAAHAPFIAAVAPPLFGWESYDELSQARDLSQIFLGREYDEWNAFRQSEESRFVALCLPRILMRVPYGPATRQVEEFRFEEDVVGPDHGKYLWGNAAYALGLRIANAFVRYGWCAAIRGVEGGGLVQGLPLHSFTTDAGEIAFKRSTETFICDRHELELAKLGFIPLFASRGTEYAVFFSTPSCHKPLQYMEASATASAYFAAQLPYILTASRFAHYFNMMWRAKLRSFTNAKDFEEWLNGWISNYVTPSPSAPDETRWKYPLDEAVVKVEDDPRRSGCAQVIAWVRPQYMLGDGLSVPMRLVVKLAAAVW